MSLSVHEIEAEILTLPVQEQREVIDFVIKLARQQTKPIKQATTQTEGERTLSVLQKTGFLASMPDMPDLSENYKAYLYSNEPIVEGQVSSLYQAFDEAGLIGCIETDEQLSTTYKGKKEKSC